MTAVAIHVDQLWFKASGGIGTYIRNLVPGLARCDPSLELKLFHARFGPDAPSPERWIRDFWMQQLDGSIRSLYPRWDVLGRPALPESLRSAEVVHATNHAAVPPAAPEQKLVVTVHDLAFEHFPNLFPRKWRLLYRLGLRAAVKRADAILTPSRSTADDVASRTKVDPARLHVVPLASSLASGTLDVAEVLARRRIRSPYVLFAGTLEPRKNLVRLVRAYRRVAATGLPHALVLAGAMGWHHEDLMREIAKPGPGEVILTGLLAEADLDALYRGASAFAYPSLYEGFGLPVVEALALGVPVASSAVGAIPEIATGACIELTPEDPEQMAGAIGRLCQDTALRESLRDEGPRRTAELSWERTAQETLAVYRTALA